MINLIEFKKKSLSKSISEFAILRMADLFANYNWRLWLLLRTQSSAEGLLSLFCSISVPDLSIPSTESSKEPLSTCSCCSSCFHLGSWSRTESTIRQQRDSLRRWFLWLWFELVRSSGNCSGWRWLSVACSERQRMTVQCLVWVKDEQHCGIWDWLCSRICYWEQRPLRLCRSWKCWFRITGNGQISGHVVEEWNWLNWDILENTITHYNLCYIRDQN